MAETQDGRSRHGKVHQDAETNHEEGVPAAPVMPNMVFHGISGQFVDALRDSTEAPREFLLAGFLTVVAALIGRRAWVAYPRPAYPKSVHAAGWRDGQLQEDDRYGLRFGSNDRGCLANRLENRFTGWHRWKG